MRWYLTDKSSEGFSIHQGAGWVVRIGYKNSLGRGIHCLQHSLQIMAKISRRNDLALGPEHRRHDWVDGKAILGNHNVGTVVQQHMPDPLNQFIGSIAQNDLRWFELVQGRQFLLQVITVAIRIQMSTFSCFFHGHHCFGGWPQGIFIGCEFGDSIKRDAQLTSDLLKRTARLING